MTEQTAMTVREEMGLSDTLKLADTLAQSGYFSDAKQAAQAAVKVLAGRELGFGPIASMTGIHIIQGRVAVGANLMASAVKRDPRYNYLVTNISDEGVTIAFFEGKAEIGQSVFTVEDARRAGTQNMGKFPRNMLFARAMSNGVKWFCPDVGNGQTMYTPEELGAEVDGDGNVIDVTPTVTKSPEPTPPAASHWIENDKARARFWAWVHNDLSLSDEDVHTALEVEHIKDYPGGMGEAKAQIEGWIANLSTIELPPEDDPFEM